jgi:uncharacterized membrane protein
MHLLQHNGFTDLLNNIGWLYATFAVIHYFSIFILVGTIVILDLRILGIAARSQGVAQLAETLSPWTWTALVLALLSGFTMFTTDATDFFPDIVFRIKMTVLFLAIVFTVIVHQNAPKWDRSPAISAGAKTVALVSLVLWVGTILAGVEIAAISGLG